MTTNKLMIWPLYDSLVNSTQPHLVPFFVQCSTLCLWLVTFVHNTFLRHFQSLYHTLTLPLTETRTSFVNSPTSLLDMHLKCSSNFSPGLMIISIDPLWNWLNLVVSIASVDLNSVKIIKISTIAVWWALSTYHCFLLFSSWLMV